MNRFALMILLVTSAPSLADHAPDHAKLEWGLGVGSIAHPDFRGSSHDQVRLIPLPYIRYRGDRLRVEDGIEGRIFKTPDILLTLSGNGSLPSSDGNAEREGMAKLDTTVELGPSLEYRIRHDDTTSLWLELPVRFALNVEDSFKSIGEVFHPRLAWRKPALNKFDWKLNLSGGPLYANADYHGYYYNVQTSEVTPTRAAYTADGGFSGLRFDFSYSRRIDQMWFGGFVRFDSLNNAEIEDSPLVTTSSNWMAGLGIAWVFGEQ